MQGLNEAQRRAVTRGDGPTLVLAGAGSGKTRVIVERLAYLVHEKGVDPRHLLAVTFTNRAANEMRTRVAERLKVPKLASWIGTFHSFGLFMLRREMDVLGRSKNFTIFDDADQMALMKRVLQELPSNMVKVSPRQALEWLSRRKQTLKSIEADLTSPLQEEITFREAANRYQATLERISAVDFDDLIVLPARLLDAHPEVRERYARRYRYVHIDEYQDTNHAQYWLAKRLSEGHGNLFVVGDEDQSIYSWRGADLNNILEFEKDFPGAQLIRLEENYRSTPQILAASNAVVAHNQMRLGKTLRSNLPPGPAVRFYEAMDAEDEARWVVDDIVERDVSPRDVAILFRTNGQSRAVEEALRRKGINYHVVGGVEFYGRKEVKDLVAYLRLLVNPADDVSVRRVLNVPPRGIGGATFERIEEYATQRAIPLLHVLREVEHDQSLPARARTSIADFLHLVDDLTLAARAESVASIVKTLLDRTGYRDYVEKSDEKDYRTRLEIVEEFVTACARFDAAEGGDLMVFLHEMALISDVDGYDPNAPAVTLLTCHSAKGLEFNEVFLLGLEEGLLPHASAFDSPSEMEEERRLCYVAMTRARQRLTLAAAQERRIYGETKPTELSRFVGEIPRGALEWHAHDQDDAPLAAKTKPGTSKVDVQQIKMGTKVWHAQFGKGVVMYTKGSGAKLDARIRFDSGRIKDFRVSLAPLQVIEGK